MTPSFPPHLDILPSTQRRLWPELAVVPAPFVLYGGTAVALYLGHRQSVDFDFFSFHHINPDSLLEDLPILRGARTLRRERNTLTVLVDRDGPVQLSFFGVPRMKMLRAPNVVAATGLRVASLLDLAGTKASVVQVRAEAKDYLDIDAIVTRTPTDLAEALGAACAIYGPTFNPQITLKALSYFEDGNVGQIGAATRERLAAAARAVDLDRLPAFAAILPP